MRMAKLEIKNRYGITPNAILNSTELSWKAKGLFGFIQSKPDGWTFGAEKIALQGLGGVGQVNSGLQELESFGLLTRVKYQDGSGHWHVTYTLHEKACMQFSEPGFSEPGFSEPGKPPNISKKDISKKELVRKIKLQAEPADRSQGVLVNELMDNFKLVNPSIARLFANKTQRAALERMLTERGFEPMAKLISSLAHSNAAPYAPTVTTPVQLETKMGSLIAYWTKLKNEQPKGKGII